MANAPVAAPPNNAHNTGEMVTPTGAAILTTLASFEHPQLNVGRIGYGLGTRDSQQYPNALALWLGSEQTAKYSVGVKLIETNIDDMSGELLGYVQERLFETGARDVWFTPIQMKKNRPATMLSVIVSADKEAEAVDLLMRETSTLGVRVRPLERIEAEREVVRIDTSLGSGRRQAEASERQHSERVARIRRRPSARPGTRPADSGGVQSHPKRSGKPVNGTIDYAAACCRSSSFSSS